MEKILDTEEDGKRKVAVIGMGTMGKAIHQLMGDEFDVVGIDHTPGALAEVETANIAILAVKPQSFAELAEALQPYIGKKQLVISIMAGITLKALGVALQTDRIVRTMPNLGLLNGESSTAYCAEGLDTADETTLKSVLDIWGSSWRLDDENKMNIFTATAGSGLAYFSLLTGYIEQALQGQGFSTGDARQIAVKTLVSTAHILDSGVAPVELASRVTSRGGTTAAARQVYEGWGFEQATLAAIDAARQRSQELASPITD